MYSGLLAKHPETVHHSKLLISLGSALLSEEDQNAASQSAGLRLSRWRPKWVLVQSTLVPSVKSAFLSAGSNRRIKAEDVKSPWALNCCYGIPGTVRHCKPLRSLGYRFLGEMHRGAPTMENPAPARVGEHWKENRREQVNIKKMKNGKEESFHRSLAFSFAFWINLFTH